jgi:two-component system, OmpR family, response regulator
MATTLLVIDDHQTFGEVVTFVLRDHGFDVVMFTDPHAALAHVSEQPPDLILSDVVMPDLDGVTLAHRIRAMGYLMPIVLISGESVAPVALAGVSVVRKTIGINELITLIERQVT